MPKLLFSNSLPSRLVAAALTIVVGITSMSGLAQASEPISAPWKRGDLIAQGWRVEAVTLHPEFVRCELEKAGQTVRVEIVARGDAQGPLVGRKLRLQPAPKSSVDEALLLRLAGELRAWEETQPETTGSLAARGTVAASTGKGVEAIGLAILNLLTVGLALFLGLRVLGPGVWPWALVALLGAIGSGVWIFVWQGGLEIPVSWVTVLHEGTTAQNIEAVYGKTRHAGPNLTFLARTLASSSLLDLRALVRMNLWLTVVQAGLLLVIARAILRHIVLALIVVSIFVLSPVGRYAALSELAAPLTSVYLLLGVGVVAALARPATVSLFTRVAGFVALASLTILMGLTRLETAGFGLIAMPWLFARLRLGDERLLGLGRGVCAWVRAGHWWAPLGLLVVGLATLPAMWTSGRIGWLIAALHPLNPSFLTAPLFLLALLPIGMVALVVLGAAQALRRWRTLGALLLATVILDRLYFSASHRVFFEMVRYTATLMPAYALLAMIGWDELEGLARRRRWGPRWRRVAMVILASLMLLPTLPEASELFWDHRAGALPTQGTLDADQQREVRVMMEAMAAFPTCLIVTRVTQEIERVEPPQGYEWRLFGGPLLAPRVVSEQEAGLEDLASKFSGVRCVLFFNSLDCQLVHGRSCRDATAGRERVGGWRGLSRRYSDNYEYGALRSPLDLGLYRVQ